MPFVHPRWLPLATADEAHHAGVRSLPTGHASLVCCSLPPCRRLCCERAYVPVPMASEDVWPRPGRRRSPREGFSQEGCAHANWGGARRTRKLDGLRCRRGGRQGVFEGQTSDGDEPGDPSPLPRLPHSGRNRAAPGGLITSDRNLVRARRDYRLFERSLDGHACSWGCAFTGVAGVQRSGRPAPWSSFGRSAKAAPHTAVGRTEDSARGAHRDPRLTGGSHAESRCPLGRTGRRDIHS